MLADNSLESALEDLALTTASDANSDALVESSSALERVRTLEVESLDRRKCKAFTRLLFASSDRCLGTRSLSKCLHGSALKDVVQCENKSLLASTRNDSHSSNAVAAYENQLIC